jgi:hypothetical protein
MALVTVRHRPSLPKHSCKHCPVISCHTSLTRNAESMSENTACTRLHGVIVNDSNFRRHDSEHVKFRVFVIRSVSLVHV